LLNTYSQCWKYVLERCPLSGPMMAQEWIQWAFRKIGETRSWTWLQKPNQFVVPDAIVTGTVNLSANDQTVFGVGTTWDGSEVGKQFRTGLTYPIYDIGAVDTNAPGDHRHWLSNLSRLLRRPRRLPLVHHGVGPGL
jgi:hypothetical protein